MSLLRTLIIICMVLSILSAWAVINEVPVLQWLGLLFIPAYLLTIYIHQSAVDIPLQLLAMTMFIQAAAICLISLYLMRRYLVRNL